MQETGAEIASLPPREVVRAAQLRTVAERAWAEMQERQVLPTPLNYELWYTHLSGSNPSLSERLSALLQTGAMLTPDVLGSLHAACIAQEIDIDTIAEGSEQLGAAAQALVEQVAGNQVALREYGDSLSGVVSGLERDRSIAGLVKAVTALTTETARASERNRVLEQQLSVSAARINKLRRELVDAKQDATTDGLTGLSNRKAFEFRLRRLMQRAKADGQALSLVLLDVDHFKTFNDTHGHRVGDLVLRLVGRVIAENVKGRDTAARYGGEEFAVILNGADVRAAGVVAGQIRAALDGKRLVTSGERRDFGTVTISAGVAQFRGGDTAAKLIERADAAMYAAKSFGRNQVCLEPQADIRFVA